MGTNYYGRVVPTQEQRQKIADMALAGDFVSLERRIKEFGEIHIGKSSAGWDFIFNLNNREYYSNESELIEWLKSVNIYSEYGEQIPFNEFWFDVVNNRSWNGKPTKKHASDQHVRDESMYISIDGREFLDCEFS